MSTNEGGVKKDLGSIEKWQSKELYNYISEENPWIQLAKKAAIEKSLTPTFPIGIVIVNGETLVSESANGNGYHEANTSSPGHKGGCVRRFISQEREDAGQPKLLSGEGFDLCPGCDTNFHAEARAIKEATIPELLKGADVYMYGHWWCCEDCWDKMKKAGINKVYAVEKFKDPEKKNLGEWKEEWRRAKEGEEK